MVRVRDNGELCFWDCEKCNQEEDAKEKLQEQSRKREARFTRFLTSGDHGTIPRRFKGKTIANYSPKTSEQEKVVGIAQKYIESFDSVLSKGTSLVFCGKPGTGKTHLAYAIASALHKHFHTASVKTAADITAEIKEAYKSDKPDVTPTSVSTMYSGFDFLAIDEVGVQVSSDAEKRIFFNVINKRYENMLPTILISNLALTELTTFVGERVIDRMRENGGIVFAFDWGSYRRKG